MRQTLFALLAAFLLLPGCPTDANDDDSANDDDATANDDDATANDDDSAGDDDDSAGDDDDSAGDDDDSAGDDDDSAGDDDDDDATANDDDSAGDDDDSASSAPAWTSETFCLDWNSVTWISPTAADIATAGSMGFNLTSVPLLMSPLSVDSGFEARLGSALTNGCVHNTLLSTADTVGTWTDPNLILGPTAVSLALGVGNFPLLDLNISGTMNAPGTQITNSGISTLVDMLTTTTICTVANCQACPGSGLIQCLPLEVVGANWNSQGANSGPMQVVP